MVLQSSKFEGTCPVDIPMPDLGWLLRVPSLLEIERTAIRAEILRRRRAYGQRRAKLTRRWKRPWGL